MLENCLKFFPLKSMYFHLTVLDVDQLLDKSHPVLLIYRNFFVLARACGVPVGRRSAGRLATTLVATFSAIIFFFISLFSAVATFSHRQSARIKKLI